MRLVSPVNKQKKEETFKLVICHPRWHRPLECRVRGRVREVVIYFKFHENRSRGLRAVEGRKSPPPIDLAHGLYNSWYYRTSRDAATLHRVSESMKPPTSIRSSEILHAGSRPGGSYIFQVSWKSVQGSQSCGGRKSPPPIDLAHGLYNSLYYRTAVISICEAVSLSMV